MRELGYPARAICLVVAAGVVIGLTGCGTAKVVNGAHKPPPDTRHHARLTIPRRIADPAAWAKNQARTLARRMLARQAIPAGARPLRAAALLHHQADGRGHIDAAKRRAQTR